MIEKMFQSPEIIWKVLVVARPRQQFHYCITQMQFLMTAMSK